MLKIKTVHGIENRKVVSQEEWLAARLELLKAEKELTHRSDEVARQRLALPWVQIEKEYQFETDEGKISLADLFCGRSQLIIYHFMLGPDYKAGCPSCSSIADEFNGIATHLAHHDVMFWAISRAPFKNISAYKQRMGWTFPWASAFESDFNSDFKVSFTEKQQSEGGIEYNYLREPPHEVASRLSEKAGDEAPPVQNANSTGTDMDTYLRERPGMSVFALEEGNIYHTYSAYARGLDVLWGLYQWLDRAPKGRNEKGMWLRRHDEYGNDPSTKSCCCP